MDVRVRVDLQLPRDASFVPVMRNIAHCLLADLRVPDDALADVQLVLSEACANVVRHAAGSGYSVSLAAGHDGCEIEVADAGPGFVEDASPASGPEAEDGRGLMLMRALVDELRFVRDEDRTRVLLRKHWDPMPAPAVVAGS